MKQNETPLIDLDLLLRDPALNPPDERNPPQTSPEQEVPTSLLQRLRDEVTAKARYLGWSDEELTALSECADETALLASRERIGRELAARFAVPPLFDAAPLPLQRRFDAARYR